MVMLYAISRSEIAYKLSEFCALKDNLAMVRERSPFAADATFG
jgi:hypothetical protein